MGVSTRPHVLWPLAIANLVANIGIVVTGGAVRLTGSGLGCPTWPRCTDASFVPHGELGIHGVIEFGNRMLTFALAAVAIALLGRRAHRLASRPLRWPAVLAVDGHRPRRTRAGTDRWPHGPHRPQSVDRLLPPAGVDGDDRGLRAAARHAPRPRARGGAAAGGGARVAGVRRRLGRPLRRHGRDRVRTARRRHRLRAQRPRPAPDQPGPRGSGVPVRGAHASGSSWPLPASPAGRWRCCWACCLPRV